MTKPTRVLIADDHPIVRSGIRRSLEQIVDLSVVAELGNGREALQAIRELAPDIAILDIEMPEMDGLGVAREVAREALTTSIIFLTLHKDEDLFQAAMDAGGKAYLLKDSATEEVVEGVRAVSAGRSYVSPAMMSALLAGRRPVVPAPASPLDKLTSSERQILQLIVMGKSSKQIGDDLAIHYRTVENHRTNICRKLGVDGPNSLLRFVLQNKLSL